MKETWGEQIRLAVVIARCKVRVGAVFLYHQMRYTLPGKFPILLMIVAAVPLYRLATQEVPSAILSDPRVTAGFLTAVHAGMGVTAVFLASMLFAKAFVVRREEEPILAHGFALPATARHRLLAGAFFSATYLLIFNYLFFGRELIEMLEHPWIVIPLHLVVSLVFLIVVGIGCQIFLRVWVVRGDANQRGQAVLSGGSVAAMLAFAGSVWGVTRLEEVAPGWFQTLGEIALHVGYFGLAPVGVVLAADGGRWFPLAGWLAALGGMVYLVWSAAASWSRVAHVEFPLDLERPRRRHHRQLVGGPYAGSRWWRGVAPFWRKDIIVHYLRQPRRYLVEQLEFLWFEVGAVIVVAALLRRDNVDAVQASALVTVVALLMSGGVSMIRGLSVLGAEGGNLATIRTVLTGGQLFVCKSVSSLVYVISHAFGHSLVIYAAARIAGLHLVSFVALAGHALGGAVVFAFVALALGFLLPDFRCRSVILPGASFTAKYIYALAWIFPVTVVGVFNLQLTAGKIDEATYTGVITFMCLSLMTTFGLVTLGALRRFRSVEL